MLKHFRRLLFISIYLSAFIFNSCIKSSLITPDEEQYIYSQNDLFKNKSEYKIKTYPNGKDYFYTKTKNKFGWYLLYSIKCIDNQNDEIKIKTTINVFFKSKDIYKLYKSNIVVNSKNEVKNREMLNQYGIDQGCFVNLMNYKYITVVSDNILYSIEIEGVNTLDLEDLLKTIHTKIAIIREIRLLEV